MPSPQFLLPSRKKIKRFSYLPTLKCFREFNKELLKTVWIAKLMLRIIFFNFLDALTSFYVCFQVLSMIFSPNKHFFIFFLQTLIWQKIKRFSDLPTLIFFGMLAKHTYFFSGLIFLVDPSIHIDWMSPFPLVYCFIFILFRIDMPISQQWRLWSSLFCSVWSGSALFAYIPKIGRQAFMG